MAIPSHLRLSRRERQIMEILFRTAQASVAEVLAAMHDPPSYSAVRATLRLLEEKGHVKHIQDGRRYVYQPTTDLSRARRSAMRSLLKTFFDGSVEHAVASLLDIQARKMKSDELDRLSALIDEAKQKGGRP
ncbi:MAG: BlaI/MecI/CopY family transcriptional regulator [Pirellulales bacterium]|nr:BlaI/MecI/CopY family transcriptional regulator [Pirellulales bacterium]